MEIYLDFFNTYFMGSVQMLTGFYFLTRFLKKKVKPIFYLLFGAASIGMIKWIPSGGILEFLAFILMLTVGGIFVCRAKAVPVLLYAVVTVEVMQLCYGMFNSILCILYPRAISFHHGKAGIFFLVFGNLALPLAAFCYHVMYRYFSYEETAKNQYVLLMLMPVLLVFLMAEYINSSVYGSTLVTDSGGNVGNADHGKILGVQILGMVSLFCIMSAYKKLLENFHLSTELSLLEQEEHSLNQYVAEAKARYEKTKSFRHDIKNHITVVRELLEKGKLEQALGYMGDMKDMAEELSFSCNTNHPTVDILLENKLGIAKGMGIEVSCFLALPNPCPVRDIDFCIILSNALDNAIHACGNMGEGVEKYIRVTGRMQGDFLLIEVRNSFQGKGVFAMGTGLSNIKAAAEKYQGTMHTKAEGGTFVLSVLLIIPQH